MRRPAFAISNVLIGLLLTAPLQVVPARGQDSPSTRFFEARVRPVLAENCFGCHGPKKQAAGIRLDSRSALIAPREGGPLVVPSRPDESRLIRAIRHTGEVKMPPAGRLKDADIQAVEQWVRAGAAWPEPPGPSSTDQGLWSLRRIVCPPVPVVRKPQSAIHNPIDAFIVSKLQQAGLRPAPPADRRTLIRRAYFDLIGLPPAPEEVEAFVSDRSERAFEKVVDRLLASPHYGERWGRHWLDVARYADSADSRGLGGEGDIAEAWRYRDWVVNALNRDMPFDQFILHQIAGDLLPGGFNRDGVIATGFLAIGNWGNGDADKDKILTDIVDDQIDAVSRGFMGLTIACARCHDHKFDPITQRDYYRLAGIFFSTHILPKLTPKGAGETPLRVPLASPEELEKRRQHAARSAELEKRLKEETETAARVCAERLAAEGPRYVLAAQEALQTGKSAEEAASARGLLRFAVRSWMDRISAGGGTPLKNALRDVRGSPGVHGWNGGEDTPSALINTSAEARQILTFTLAPRSVAIHPGPNSGVAVAWKSPLTGRVEVSGRVSDADSACGEGIAWELRGPQDRAAAGRIPNGGSEDFGPLSLEVRRGQILRLVILPGDGHACDTTTVELVIRDSSGGLWKLSEDLVPDPLSGNPHEDSRGNPGVWTFMSLTGGPDVDGAWQKWGAALQAGETGTEEAARALAAAFAKPAPTSPFWPGDTDLEEWLEPEKWSRLRSLRAELAELRRTAPPPLEYANGAQEGGVPESPHAGIHDVPIHIRGRYDRLGDLTPRGFPAVLGGEKIPPITQGSGRLELARWLADPEHPLTARVIVNRLWQHHFGQGLVRTPSNFGALGEKPTHPELLDWLAGELMRSSPDSARWSLKRIHRLIMTSAAYQRSSIADAGLASKDPDNRLLGRMNRRRLEAEPLRDALLSAAGRLDLRMGGPADRDPNSPRRALYLMTIRSDRTGYGPLFDAADPTAPVDRRTISTVAPQALYLLNNPLALDAAEGLAKRLLSYSKENRERLIHAYRLLYSRPPSDREIGIGLQFLNMYADGERAAWTAYAQVLLCANEFIYVD